MSSATAKVEAKREFQGIHFLLCMVAFFGVIIAVNITMAVMASKSWTGLVVKNTYVASQEFNGKLEQARAQRALGLHSELQYANGTLLFTLKDRDGKALLAENVEVKIGRPAFEQSDRVYSLGKTADGAFQLDTDLAQGEWSLTIAAEADGNHYRRDARIFVRADGTGRVR